jgi:hypothetical protein
MRGRAVWKFPLSIGIAPPVADIAMPVGAEILHVGQQDDVPTVWALVDPGARATEARHLLAVPTGFELPFACDYLGTTHIHDGRIVVHVFEAAPSSRGGAR